MRWIAIFTDTPAMLAVRAQWGNAHLAYLDQHRDEIVLAGGCRHSPEGDYVGGLWILDVPDRARVVQLVDKTRTLSTVPASTNCAPGARRLPTGWSSSNQVLRPQHKRP